MQGTHEYEIFITVEGTRLVASCRCPFFDDRFETCKHAWAVVEAAVAQGHFDALADVARPRVIAGGRDDDLDDIYGPNEVEQDPEPMEFGDTDPPTRQTYRIPCPGRLRGADVVSAGLKPGSTSIICRAKARRHILSIGRGEARRHILHLPG